MIVPSFFTPVLKSHQHRMASAMAVEHLLAGEADLHRAIEHQRRLGDRDLVIEGIALAAEAAAVRRRDHADVRGRHRERFGERAMDVVRRLRARPQHELAVRIASRRPPRAARSGGACCPHRRKCPRRRGPPRRSRCPTRRTPATLSCACCRVPPYSWIRGSSSVRLRSDRRRCAAARTRRRRGRALRRRSSRRAPPRAATGSPTKRTRSTASACSSWLTGRMP